MRPINLIPQEERRSHGAISRTGPLAYVIVGALAVLLVGVVMLVLANNDISDREAEVTTLEAQRALAVAEAEELAPYASFQQVSEERTQTITSLADSRFDWVRVIRQLSLILPPDVYLTSLTGSAGGGGEGGIAGPSLSLSGCAPGQDMVAVFVASLKEIDGVTRVGLNSSALSGSEGGDAAAGGYCAVGNKALFEIVVAFDAAPPSPNGETSTFETPSEEEGAEAEEGEEGAGEGSAPEGSSETSSGETASATVGSAG
jgi:Tfp pilus assembly protein PilN